MILQVVCRIKEETGEMRPGHSAADTPQGELFGVELVHLLDLNHPLVRLSARINWGAIDEALSPCFHERQGAPAKPTRLMAGLHYLKSTYDLSDEEVVARWVENPYWQYFCGAKYFEHALPIDPSSMTRWRNRVGEEGIQSLLQRTIETAIATRVVNERSFTKLNVDTTVQEKAIVFPTDAKLYYAMRQRLIRLSRKLGLTLRQSFVRLAKKALIQANRYAHAGQMKRKRKAQRQLKTYLGRVVRDIERQLEASSGTHPELVHTLAMANRLLAQERKDTHKLYSIHAPEVECISKGKVHKRYEFGVKVSLVSTSKEGLILSSQALHGNPYDGHTLAASLKDAEKHCNRPLRGDIFVDRGYRGHDYQGPAAVHLAGRSTRRMTAAFKRWYKRRAAIEPLIGHLKTDGRLDRNYLKGTLGDKINAVLCACGQNMRLLLNRATSFLRLVAASLHFQTVRLTFVH